MNSVVSALSVIVNICTKVNSFTFTICSTIECMILVDTDSMVSKRIIDKFSQVKVKCLSLSDDVVGSGVVIIEKWEAGLTLKYLTIRKVFLLAN